MKVKDLQSVFGIPVDELKRHGKRYRIIILLLYLFDAVAIFGSTAYMFFHGVQYQWYWYVLVLICIVVNIAVDRFLGVEKYMVYKFYSKNLQRDIVENRYVVDVKDMRSIVHSLGQKPVDDSTIQSLQPCVIAACAKNVLNSYRFMTKMSKLEADCGNVVCRVFGRGGKQYFVDFVTDFGDAAGYGGGDSESVEEAATETIEEDNE